MATGTSVKLVIPTEIRLVDVVHAVSERVADLAGFDADDALNVGLAVREAVINAMVHGNQQDPKLKVTVTLTAWEGRIKATVKDQGNGFDADRITDPTSGDALLATSGRGLLLIRAFVDEVDFRPHPSGTEIVLIKRRAAQEEKTKQEQNAKS